jgi:hypothetical protein
MRYLVIVSSVHNILLCRCILVLVLDYCTDDNFKINIFNDIMLGRLHSRMIIQRCEILVCDDDNCVMESVEKDTCEIAFSDDGQSSYILQSNFE